MLRHTALYLCLFLAVGASQTPAAAQEIAGRWAVDVVLDAGSGQATFVFEVSGNQITGTYAGVLGDQSVTGTIDGNEVRFGFESPDAGEVIFEGVVQGSTMEGTCEYGLLGSGTFSGTRAG